MSFEQPAYSFNASGGEPPTPTRTPSSPSFFDNSYYTPKQDSKFHDPLSPWPPAFGSSPLFPVSSHTAHTPPTNGDFTSSLPEKSKTIEDVASEIAARAQFSASNSNITLAPVDTSRQLPSSPQPSLQIDTNPSTAISGSDATPLKDPQEKAASESMNSAGSMQTPPPTSTSTSRRKASEAQVARSTRALASKADMDLSASTEIIAGTSQQVEESPPVHFPNLQFSPDGFSMPLSGGPATAPVYPQHKLFWDPEQTMDAMNLDFPMDDNFANFGLGLQKQLEPFVSEHDLTAGSNGVTGTSAISIPNSMAPRHSIGLNQTNISSSVAIMTQGSSRSQFSGTVVNPSLLFSSPGRDLVSSSQAVEDDSLKPYAHQIQDAEYERELQSRRPKRKRGAELDSPAVKAATQALRSAEDRSSVDSSETPVIATFNASMRPASRHSRRRSSHLRNSSRGHEKLSDSVDSKKRTSVTLTIDENGRAKTETKVVEGSRLSMSSRMNLDSSSSDSDSSSSRSSQGMTFSQQASFAFPMEGQKRTKTPKSHSRHGIETSHSHHSSYASTIGSNSAPIHDPKKRSSHTNLRKQSQPQVRFSSPTFPSAHSPSADSEASTIVDTDSSAGNAASELKKVVRQRSNQKLPRQPFSDHHRKPSAATPYYAQHHTTTPSRLGSSHNISPTTLTDPDLATPSTGARTALSASANSTIRCICNVREGDGQLMVQCDSCNHWLHLSCVGLHQRNIPEIYLCVFCNRDTPRKPRGGTRREPARATFPPPAPR